MSKKATDSSVTDGTPIAKLSLAKEGACTFSIKDLPQLEGTPHWRMRYLSEFHKAIKSEGLVQPAYRELPMSLLVTGADDKFHWIEVYNDGSAKYHCGDISQCPFTAGIDNKPKVLISYYWASSVTERLRAQKPIDLTKALKAPVINGPNTARSKPAEATTLDRLAARATASGRTLVIPKDLVPSPRASA